MTILSDKELKKIANNEFSLEFLRAKLVQQVANNPTVYTGPGSITQTSDGKLQLKMYCLIESSEDLAKELNSLGSGNGLEPGQLIGSEHYFAFEGLDVFGQIWKATDIWESGDVSFPASGRIVRSDLRSVESRIERPATSMGIRRTVFVVPGTYKFPFTQGQPGTSEPSFSACKIDLGEGRTCEVKTHGAGLVIVINFQAADLENYSQRVLEAIGLCVGAHLVPQVEITLTEKGRIQILRRLNKDSSQQHRIMPPIPGNYPDDLAGLQDFSQRYLKQIKEPYSQLAGYWFRVLVSLHSGLENQALVLTTAIEGFLKAYFPDHGKPDEEFVKQLEEAIPKAKVLSVGTRARERILNTLGHAKAPTPSNALSSLSQAGKIPADLVKVWKALRNRSAHADELKLGASETQVFINELYACLELLYRLIMLHIGFEGRMTRYARVGWPEQNVAEFSTEEPTCSSGKSGSPPQPDPTTQSQTDGA